MNPYREPSPIDPYYLHSYCGQSELLPKRDVETYWCAECRAIWWHMEYEERAEELAAKGEAKWGKIVASLTASGGPG